MNPIPTPTLLPEAPVDFFLEIPQGMNLWEFAPDAVQIYNTVNRTYPYMTLLQAVILFMLVGAGIMTIVVIANQLTKDTG